MRFRLIYFLITALLVSSCVKEITELPPATQSGANTFGCKIDGAFWVPAGFGIIPTSPKLRVWKTATDDLPLLVAALESALATWPTTPDPT